jgi:lipopolysaccharide transport system permease protein
MSHFKDSKRLFSKSYWQSAYMIAKLSLRDQFKNSFLGMGWALIQPLVYIFILTVVMSVIFHMATKEYAVYIMSGMLPWQFFCGTLTRGGSSITSRRGIFHHTPLPKTMFVMADVMTQLYLFSIMMIVAIIVTIVLIGFSPTLLLLPFTLAPLIITSTALAVMFGYISAYVWDTPHILNILFQSLVWTVPIMYPMSLVPEHLRVYFMLNPMYLLIRPTQVLMYEKTIPAPLMMGGSFGVAIATCLLAYFVYTKLRKNVIYYL